MLICNMSDIAHAIDLIRKAHAALGTAEFARLSGVPYTTLRECEARDFVGPSVETLKKLEAAARRANRKPSSQREVI